MNLVAEQYIPLTGIDLEKNSWAKYRSGKLNKVRLYLVYNNGYYDLRVDVCEVGIKDGKQYVVPMLMNFWMVVDKVDRDSPRLRKLIIQEAREYAAGFLKEFAEKRGVYCEIPEAFFQEVVA